MLLAHGSPAIELLAVTTVAGNQTLEKVTRNALAVAEIAGIQVPIAAGCPRPLVREIEVAPSIHGDSGMDGPQLPAPRRQLDPRHAVDLIIELIMQYPPGEITLVPTGALIAVGLTLTVFAGPIFSYSQRAATEVLDRTQYVSAVLGHQGGR